jgi:hypothetical protein
MNYINIGKKVSFIATLMVLHGISSPSAQTLTKTFGTGANAFSMEFVQVANPGNAADTTGRGSVSYIYNIGKYEVSRDVVIKASTAGGLGVTLGDMTSLGGNGLNRAATSISWNEAARIVNYLNTSLGYEPAYNFTSSGYNANITSWTSSYYGYNPSNVFRSSLAYFFLPSLDEWYKAAYYDPNKSGGPGYWKYPTMSNTAPAYTSGGTTSGTAVYGGQTGPADITNAGGLSAYGVMGLGGNVWEWAETAADLSNNLPNEMRITRGGAWDNISSDLYLSSDFLTRSALPTDENIVNGFRVAMIPEPSAFSLLAVGLSGLSVLRRRRS